MEQFIHSEKKPEKKMLEIPNKYIPKLEQFQSEHPEIVYKYYLKIKENYLIIIGHISLLQVALL